MWTLFTRWSAKWSHVSVSFFLQLSRKKIESENGSPTLFLFAISSPFNLPNCFALLNTKLSLFLKKTSKMENEPDSDEEVPQADLSALKHVMVARVPFQD